MIYPTFWADFEETSGELLIDAATQTQTKAREEPDQLESHVGFGTQTATECREEVDQDPKPHGLATFHRVTSSQTQTVTATREERDQDPARSGLATVQRIATMNTQTLTGVKREEASQSESVRRIVAFSRVSVKNV